MFRDNLSGDLIRPIIYKVFTRLIYGTVFSLALDFFINDPLRNMKSYGFALCAALCALGAWLAYLRRDGMRFAKVPGFRLPRRRKPMITYGDMMDNIDEPVRDMEEMTDEEKDTAVFIADIILTAVFALISILV